MAEDVKEAPPTLDRAGLMAELKAKEDLDLKKCQVELGALLEKYNAEMVPSFLFVDGRIQTQLGLRIKRAE